VRRVVPVEVTNAVLVERDPRRAGLDRLLDVGAVGLALVVLGDAQRRQGRGKLSVSRGIALHQLRAEAPDPVGAEIALAGNRVTVPGMGFREGSTAEAARLLRPA